MGFQSGSVNMTLVDSDMGREHLVNNATSFLFGTSENPSNFGTTYFGTEQKDQSSFLLPTPSANTLSLHSYGVTWGQ